jgi:hypothetical protein
MKKNGKLILLSILVLGIWGTIGYRIIAGLDPAIDEVPRPVRVTPKVEAEAKIELALSYPDPFLGQRTLAPAIKKNSEVKVIVPKEDKKKPVVLVDWSKVEYVGLIRNPERNVHIATLRIGGQDYFVKEGEQVDIFVVSKITKDSIQVMLNDQVNYIKRKN